jgi:hypothetical protein
VIARVGPAALRTSALARGALVSGLVALLSLGCQAKNNGTLLVVLLDTNLPAGQVDRIEVEVKSSRGNGGTHSFPIGSKPRPFKMALVPEGDPALDLDIVAKAIGGGQALVTLAASVSFEPKAAREMFLLLSRDCVTSSCPGAQQCVEGGACVAKKQVATLRPLGTTPTDASAPVDMGAPVVDAAPDVTPDVTGPPREAGVVTGTWMSVMGPALNGGVLNGVAPVSDKEVWAVGTAGIRNVIARFDGTAWLQVPITTDPSPLNAVWAAGPGDVWAVGYNGTVLHRVGEVFSRVPLPGAATPTLNAVFGTGPNDIWITGAMRSVFHWDGTGLTAQAEGVTSELNAVTATSPTDVWAAGNGGGIYRRVGNAWVRQAEGMTGAVLYGIWASSSRDVWAVGDGVAVHFDGATWTTSALQGVVGLAVWGTADNDVWAVGRHPGGFVAHFDGFTWTPVTIPAIGALLAVRGVGANDIWAVGKDGILHYR